MYLTIKTIHVSCAIISVCGFSLRGLIKLYRPHWLQARWLRIAPHAIDSLLLASAIYLAVQSQQYPLQQAWLTAKLLGLLAYIGFGMMVMRFAQNQRQRLLAYLLALASFSYILAVAITRSPLPWA